MRSAAFIALGFTLLVTQAALSALFSAHPLAPNLLLPVVIYVGVTHDVSIVRGAILSFVLGYMLDSFCGTAMGLHTFVLVATFLVARGAGLSLFSRGAAFQVVLTFAVGLFAGGTILALRAIFEKPAPFPAGDIANTARLLAIPALMTAVFAPLIFVIVRKIDGAIVRRREEAAPT